MKKLINILVAVIKTTDPDPFEHPYNNDSTLCDPEMYGTLQWAVRKTNDATGDCIIDFDIPGSGPYTIALNYYLPQIRNTVTIDGTTQSGYQFHNPAIIIDGQGYHSDCINGYNTDNIIIGGLYIKNFLDYGIILTNCNNFHINQCVINRIDNGSSIYPAAGIRTGGVQNCTITGNLFGTDNSGTDFGNENYGILFLSSTSNSTIGGTGTNEGNIIACNGTAGIYIGRISYYNLITRNKIYNNPTAIKLIADANQNKPAPVITGYDAVTNIITGTSQPNDIIEIFGSTGSENANEYLINTIADISGNWSVQITEHNWLYVIATATDANNNTSQLSNALMAELPLTKLIDEDCGAMDVALDQILEADEVPGAIKYEFLIEEINSENTFTVLSANNLLDLSTVTGLMQGRTYSIKVRTYSSNNIASPYGESCLITTDFDKDYERTIYTELSELMITNGTWKSNPDLMQEETFDKVSLANSYKFTEEVGAPKLPVKIEKILLPLNVKVKNVTIINTIKEELTESYYILPSQPDFIVNEKKPDFVPPDTNIYNSNAPYPGYLVEIVSDDIVMGYHILTLQFNPIEYIPVQKKVNVYTQIDYSINFKNELTLINQSEIQSKKRYNLVRNYVKNIIANKEEFDSMSGGPKDVIDNNNWKTEIVTLNIGHFPYDYISLIPDYIIITNNELVPEFDQLAEYKFKKGIPTIVITIDEISANYSGVDYAEKIRNYLIDAYNNWGAGLFVLLGGDTDIIPARICFKDLVSCLYDKASDLYYASTTGTWDVNNNGVFGEIINDTGLPEDEITSYSATHFVGRASVEDISEAQLFIDKIIDYENYSGIENNSYAKRFLLLDGISGGINTYDITNNNGEYLELISYPTASDPYEILLNKENALNELNNGQYNIVYHMDHSSPFGMGLSSHLNEGMNVVDADELINEPYQHVFISGGCSPNTFVVSSISEHLLNNPNGGCVAYIGNSSEGWSSDFVQFYEFLHGIYGINMDKITNIGIIFNHIKQYGAYITNFDCPGDVRRPQLRLNLLGDPEMPVWTDIPNNLIVSHVTDIFNEEQTISIDVNNSFIAGDQITICLFKEGEIYRHQTLTSTGGTVTGNFFIYPNTAGILDVMVTSHNYIPNESQINVLMSPNPQLYVSSVIYDDLLIGNLDDKPDAGENVNMKTGLTNSGGINAVDVSATVEAYTVYESFEGDFLPFGWDIQNVISDDKTWYKGNDTYDDPGNGTVEGNYLAYFSSDDHEGESELKTPFFIIQDNSLKFWMYHDGIQNTTGNDILRIRLIKKNIVTNSVESDDLLAEINRYTGTIGWQEHIIDLNIHNFSDAQFETHRARIVFHAILSDDPLSNDIYIDKVVVTSPFISFINNITSYGDINSGTEVISTDNYNFDINVNTPDQTTEYLHVLATDFNSNEYKDEIFININKPILEQSDKIYSITYDENVNGEIDINDVISLNICIINKGHASTGELTSILDVNAAFSSDVDITQSTSTYNDIIPIYSDPDYTDDINIQPFVIEFITATDPATIIFELEVTDEHGRIWNFSFDIDDVPVIDCNNLIFLNGINYIKFIWDEVPGILGYNIYRCDIDEDGNQTSNYERLNQLLLTSSNYTDEYLQPLQEYRFKIHTVSSDGDESEEYCEKDAWTSLNYHPSFWPQNTFFGLVHQQVAVIDIDGDENEEVFLSSRGGQGGIFGYIMGFNQDGTPRYESDGNLTTVADFDFYNGSQIGEKACFNGPTLADVDNNGIIDLIAAFNKRIRMYSTKDLDNDDSPDLLWEYDYYTGSAYDQYQLNSPLVCDLDGDDKLEIIVHEIAGRIIILNYKGEVLYDEGSGGWTFTMPVVVDIDGADDPYCNTCKELIHFQYITDEDIGKIYLLDHDENGEIQKNVLAEWPEYDFRAPPTLADFTGSGDYKIITVAGDPSDDTKGFVNVWNLNGTKFWSDDKIVDIVTTYRIPGITVGDIDNDNEFEIIFFGHEKLYIWHKDGTDYTIHISTPEEETSPFNLSGYSSGAWMRYPLIADVDGDNSVDIILSCDHGKILAVNNNIEHIKFWPVTINGFEGNVIISDIDADNDLEMLVSNSAGTIYAWELSGDEENVEWGMPRYNSWNTATYGDLTLDIVRDGEYCNDMFIGDVTATAIVSGGKKPYSYLWSTGEITRSITDIAAGTEYWVSATDSKGNSITRTFSTGADFVIADNYSVTGVESYIDQKGAILGEVIVENGGELTFTNCDVYTLEFSNIIVEPGGELILNNSIITTCDDVMWEGVITRFSDITSGVNEPKVAVINSTIENAKSAVFTNMTGAVQASGSTFRNNEAGIYMKRAFHALVSLSGGGGWPYSYYKLNSHIYNCTFETTKELNDPELYPKYHVRLDSYGMTLRGNTFQNTMADNIELPVWKRGIGIESYNSKLTIRPFTLQYVAPEEYCDGCPTNNFDGLYYGVKANAGYLLSDMMLKQANFTNNYHGAYIGGFRGSRIIYNDFNVGIMGDTGGEVINYGLYLYGSTSYKLQENIFHDGDVGVYINNSGYLGFYKNTVYKNEFSNIRNTAENGSGIIALGKNSNYSTGSAVFNGSSGLEILCNTLTTNSFHTSLIDGTIENIQGQLIGEFIPARNTMTHECFNPTGDFHIENSSMDYLYMYNLNDNDSRLFCHSEEISNLGQVPTEENLQCPSLLNGGIGPIPADERLQEFITQTEIVAQAEEEFISMVDNGDTEGLLNKVIIVIPKDYKDLCNELLDAAPYLSDTVLVEFMRNDFRGRPNKKRDVLLATSPLPQKAKEELPGTWLPKPFKQQVEEQQDGISVREQFEMELSDKKTEKQSILNDLISIYTDVDTQPEDKEAIISVFSEQDDYMVTPLVVSMLFEEDRIDEAGSELSDLEGNIYELPQQVQEKITDYIQLQQIIIEIINSSEDSINIIIENNLDFLNQLALDETRAVAVTAQYLLEISDFGQFSEKVVLPDKNRSFIIEEEDIFEEDDPSELINIFPNPANDIIEIEYLMLDNYGDDYSIGIYSLDGKLVKSIPVIQQFGIIKANVSDIPSGGYIVSFGNDGIREYSCKIIVFH